MLPTKEEKKNPTRFVRKLLLMTDPKLRKTSQSFIAESLQSQASTTTRAE